MENLPYEIESSLDRIERRYNPEFDLIPDGPIVPWSVSVLADAVRLLAQEVDTLKAEVAALKEQAE